jgi:hypothetical protein
MKRVWVPTAGLKIGDVLEEVAHYSVVTQTCVSSDLPTAALLRDDGGTGTLTAGESGNHARVGQGCEPNIEALKEFVEALKTFDR